MADLVKLIQARFRRLLVDFELTHSIELVTHPGESGRLHESTLRAFLRDYLPQRIGVGTGQIAEALRDEQSKQVDIVLYDQLNYPVLLREEGYQLFMAESVLAALEVKSYLDKRRLEESIENIVSVKSKRKFPQDEHRPTLGVCFAYGMRWTQIDTFLERFFQLSKDIPPEHRLDLVVGLQPGFLLVFADTLKESIESLSLFFAGEEPRKIDLPSGHFCLISIYEEKWNKENILLLFYLLISDYLNRVLDIGVPMSQYTKSPYAWSWRVIDPGQFADGGNA